MEQTYRFEPRIAHSLALQAAPDLAAPLDADPWRNAPMAGELWDLSRRGEMANYVDASEEEISDDAGLRAHARVGETGWEAAVEVPFALIGLDGAVQEAVIGFDFERVRTSLPRRHWRWSPGMAAFSNTPLDYGDLYLTPPGPAVTAIDLGEVVYEGSFFCLTVATEEDADPRPLGLTSRVVMPRDDEVYDEQQVVAGAQAGGVGDFGHYDSWVGPHIVNFYLRSIAHNTGLPGPSRPIRSRYPFLEAKHEWIALLPVPRDRCRGCEFRHPRHRTGAPKGPAPIRLQLPSGH